MRIGAALLATALTACTPQTQAQTVVLPGTLDLAPPAGAKIVNDCAPIIAPPEYRERKVACAYFIDNGPTQISDDNPLNMASMETMEAWMKAMQAAGWKFAHLALYEHYFERPRAGTDCSDIATLISLPIDEMKKLVASDAANGAFEGRLWRGYMIPAELGEACGGSRKLQ